MSGEPGPARRRTIRSFVVRGGRLTDAQQRALDELWPRYGVAFEPRPLDLAALFGRGGALHAGDRLRQRRQPAGAGRSRTPNAISSVWKCTRPASGICCARRQRQGLNNLRSDPARRRGSAAAAASPPESLDSMLVLFPDPWHKKRHHKRRLVNPEFAALAASRPEAGWHPAAGYRLGALCRRRCSRCSMQRSGLRNRAADRRFVPRNPAASSHASNVAASVWAMRCTTCVSKGSDQFLRIVDSTPKTMRPRMATADSVWKIVTVRATLDMLVSPTSLKLAAVSTIV